MPRDSVYTIRPATPSDEPFLREMLYQSLYVEDGAAPFPLAVVHQAELARYVKGWGRRGDLGFIAVEAGSNLPIGAAWSRLAEGADKGFAYVDDETPELAVAVLPGYRGQGIGTDLLKRLLAEAERSFPAMSLSVSPDNPARRLYERLGFETLDVRGGHPLMRKNLKPSPVSVCYKCDYESDQVLTDCPECGKRMRPAAQVKVLGWILLLLGTFLVLFMGAITFVVASIISRTGEPGSTQSFNGGPKEILMIFGIFGLVLAFGFASMVAGFWQVRYGRRSKHLVKIMVGIAIALLVIAELVQVLF